MQHLNYKISATPIVIICCWRARLSSDESVRRSPRRQGTEEGLPPRAGGMSRVGEEFGGEVFRKRSGEASGRVGGISEQSSASSAWLASPGSTTGSRDLRTKQTSHSGDLGSPLSKLMGTSVSSSFSSAKNVPTAVGSLSLVVPKRSSSVTMSGPCEAKKQLQKLVEELEVPSEGSSPATHRKQIDSVPPTASASPLVVSCTSRVRSPSPLPSRSTSQTTSPTTSQEPATSRKVVSKPQEPALKSSSGLKIPEPVAKINATENKYKHSEGKVQQTVASSTNNSNGPQIKPTTMVIGRKDEAKSSTAGTKPVSNIPSSVCTINAHTSMTKSLPPEEVSSVLHPSKNNRYSMCLDVPSNASSASTGVPQKPPLTGTLSMPVTGTAGNALSISTSSIESCSQSSPLVKQSDSASSVRNKRISLLVEPHKKLFPWETAVTSGTSTEPTVSAVARQKSLLTPYRRGKSEDLRSAIDTVGKIDSSFERYKKAAAAASSTSDQPIIKPYKGSRSRELNPTIEAASEKLIQPNPSNMKKISPFEAYRRSKTKELGSTIEQLQKQQVSQSQSALKLSLTQDSRTRMTSPPPGLPQSPTSIARLSSPPPQSTVPASSPGSSANILMTSTTGMQNPVDSSSHSEQAVTLSKSNIQNLPVDSPSRSEHTKSLILSTPGTCSPTDSIKSVLASPISSGPSSNRNSPIVAPNELRAENTSPTYSQANGSAVMRAKTPFERAKNKIEKKIDRAKSPTFFIDAPTIIQNDVNMEIATRNMLQNELSSGDWYNGKDPSKHEESEVIKKSMPSEPEKPKSMYKKFTSKFSKSATNVSEDSSEQLDSTVDDKFKLKRPSIFLKSKNDRTEKSPSRASIAETEEQTEKKPSKKLSDALNKFLGRKTDEISKPTQPLGTKPQSEIPSALTSDLARSERDLKKPSRYRAKVFSKSHENLNKYNDDEMKAVLAPTQSEDQNFTIESVTKSICDHLTQLESDITSRIGSMNNPSESESFIGEVGVAQNRQAAAATSGTSLTSYCYSPALPTRCSTSVSVTITSNKTGDTTGVKKSVAPKKEVMSANTMTTTVNSVRSQPAVTVSSSSQKVESGSNEEPKTKLEATESMNSVPDDIRCFSPTSWCSDGVTSAPDELQGLMSDDDEESVMDRITRKSFYSRFQDGKRRRSKVSQPLSKFDEDQQLAAAKARLIEDERKQRESLSPTRAMSPMSCTRTSIGSSISDWEKSLPRRSIRSSVPRTTSLPINDYDPRLIVSAENFNFSSTIGDSARSSVSRAAAAGAAAGAAAASYQTSERETSVSRRISVSATDAAVPSYRSVTTDSALSRMRSPSPPKSMWSPPHDTAVSSARDELSRRLTPLTRLASSREPSVRPYRRTTTTGDLSISNEPSTTSSRPAVYRRTTTTGNYELPKETSSTLPRPSYRRTSTMDLPVADPAINRPSDYRRLLQPTNRRYSTARISDYSVSSSNTSDTISSATDNSSRKGSTSDSSSRPSSTSSILPQISSSTSSSVSRVRSRTSESLARISSPTTTDSIAGSSLSRSRFSSDTSSYRSPSLSTSISARDSLPQRDSLRTGKASAAVSSYISSATSGITSSYIPRPALNTLSTPCIGSSLLTDTTTGRTPALDSPGRVLGTALADPQCFEASVLLALITLPPSDAMFCFDQATFLVLQPYSLFASFFHFISSTWVTSKQLISSTSVHYYMC
ncbi:hypothetical protein FHG87_011386 [Trinorchestia longiramus]|nr:hypothetical protein FHG87_011386 [Trinorchestia longiramus]